MAVSGVGGATPHGRQTRISAAVCLCFKRALLEGTAADLPEVRSVQQHQVHAP